MENKKCTYKCSYCGKEYFSAVERAECELECHKREEKKKTEEKKALLENEKKKRKGEVKSAFQEYVRSRDKYLELRNKYIKDYGSYEDCYDIMYSNNSRSWEDLVDIIFASL